MEEYVKHIADTHVDRSGKSICGKGIACEWAFVSIDHAFLSQLAGSLQLPCPDCVKIVIDAISTDAIEQQ